MLDTGQRNKGEEENLIKEGEEKRNLTLIMGKFCVKRDIVREKILKISEKVDLKNFFLEFMSLFGVFELIIRVKKGDTFYAVIVKLKFVIFPKS